MSNKKGKPVPSSKSEFGDRSTKPSAVTIDSKSATDTAATADPSVIHSEYTYDSFMHSGAFGHSHHEQDHHKKNETHTARETATLTSIADLDLLLGEEDNDVDIQKEREEIAARIAKSFSPVKILLQSLGRWPVMSKRNPDGTTEYWWEWRSIGGIYFILVTFLVIYTLVLGTVNMLAILMGFGSNTNRSKSANASNPNERFTDFGYEKALLQRHMVTFIVLWTALIHCAITSISFISKRNFFGFYFTFWSKALPAMMMDGAKDTFRLLLILVISYVATILSLILLALARVSPASVSAPTLYGVLLFRGMYPAMFKISAKCANGTTQYGCYDNFTFTFEEPKSSTGTRITITCIGGLFLIIVFAASTAYMFIFIYKCKLLRNAFAQWNSRAYASILKGEPESEEDFGRSTFTLLFRDHCVLLDLMEGTDQLFSTVLESYFGLQLCSICFQFYLFIRTARYGYNAQEAYANSYYIRPNDWLPAIIIFVQSVVMLSFVALSAAEVGEEAMAGLEVLRRRSMMGRKTNDELYFMLTMFASYTAYKKMELSGGGYFYLNKEFIIGVISTIFSYFIILFQFQPTLDHKESTNEIFDRESERLIYGTLFHKLEYLPRDHYLNPPPPN